MAARPVAETDRRKPRTNKKAASEGGGLLALLERTGRVLLPYLIDPNADSGTGTEMFESAAIIDYLERTYAV